jgi:hypothetical protein
MEPPTSNTSPTEHYTPAAAIKLTDPVAARAMAEKRPAVSGPEEAITDMEEDPKRPRHKGLIEAELQAQVRPPALPSKPCKPASAPLLAC